MVVEMTQVTISEETMKIYEDLARDSLRKLCRRLIDIDKDCDEESGCPFELAAHPMIMKWVSQHRPGMHTTEQAVVHRLLTVRMVHGDQGCTFSEVYDIAYQYLEFV